MLRKLLTWAFIIFIVFYLATQPAGAARVARSAGHGLHQAATSLTEFVNNL